MNLNSIGRHALVALAAGGALVIAAACGPRNTPITVTGCLQRDGGDFILTAMNEPSTSGAPAAVTNKVDREEITEAKHAYKLSDVDEDQVRPMVGNSIKVVGTLARRADVTQAVERKSDELEPSDLAEIDVARVARVARSCGPPSAGG
jgi:hypothetical protein